jgi:predicted enzyme related to lactoylglutathione lyase
VTVASADESAERAKELGGSVVAGPFDVFGSGRMVVVADPGGATLGLWEPREHIGAQVVNELGAISWNDLATHDAAQAKDFYRGLLGWEYDEANEEIAGYTIVQHAGASEGRQGGIRQMRPEEEGIPSYWSVYFPVEDAGAAGEQLSAAGGSVHVPPTEVPAGRFSVVADPQGAVFALFEGPLDP